MVNCSHPERMPLSVCEGDHFNSSDSAASVPKEKKGKGVITETRLQVFLQVQLSHRTRDRYAWGV